jgi:transposase, IS5 family
MFRTVGDQPPLWESLLPAEVLRLPDELARVDALLDDPAFFAPFAPYFHPVPGRPSTPAECYLRLMFLKYRYRLGFEIACLRGFVALAGASCGETVGILKIAVGT